MTGHWAWPARSRKAHYFVDGRSLCGNWLFDGEPLPTQTVGATPGPDDCVACHRRLLKLRLAQEGAK